MEGIPMDPEHHRQMRIGRCTCGAGDVEVETFELGLAQVLVGNAVFRQVEDLLFNALEFWLGADGPEGRGRVNSRLSKLCDVSQTRNVYNRPEAGIVYGVLTDGSGQVLRRI